MNQGAVGPLVACVVSLVVILYFFWLRLRIRLGDDDIILQIARGKAPVRFNRDQLVRYTKNYSVRLGAGAFGTVYAATLPNGLKLAVKKLHAGVDWRSEAEFVADVVGTIWQARHTNHVRLVGYCFHLDTSADAVAGGAAATVRAMVCEYMERGALDAFLVDRRGRDRDAGRRLPDLDLIRSLAVGVARGVEHLHDGCPQNKIVHYGIKPGNVLLDGKLTPKVSDFGLAQLMRRGGNTHAAVSLQPPSGLAADKLDVYSFGVLVLQILALALAQRMNYLIEESSQQLQWFPRVTWTKYESGNLMDLVVDHDDGHAVVVAPGDDDDLLQRMETVERMCKVAFWCMQWQTDARPPKGMVVKMLEGDIDIAPPPNPFKDLVWGDAGIDGDPAIIPFDQINVQMKNLTVEKFLQAIRHEKPLRFTPRQIAAFTRNYTTKLGSGGFGTVFKGALPNGLAVAVKVFHGSLHQKTEEAQFMAEVGTIGRTHHVNLVRLIGFCFNDALRALVYEYMEHGALDTYLAGQGRDDVGVPALRDIAVGVARGIRYLHEECQQKIVHYDIKPGNVLLDGELTPKVADFGLARLVSRADTHFSVSGIRGTPGYAAPEMWTMQSGVTEKCDVYSFGMLLLEIVGRRRNFDEAAPESQRWFPMLAWNKYDRGELAELIVVPSCHGTSGGSAAAARATTTTKEQEEQCREIVERMCKVAFWCVQQLPEARPPMSAVTKMLEGEVDITPPPNPFQHLMAAPHVVRNLWTTMTGGSTGNNGTLTP